MKQEENILEPVFDAIKTGWRHRPPIKLGKYQLVKDHRIAAMILDTVDALELTNKAGLKPVMVKDIATDYGARIIFHLPAGISRKEVENKLQYLEEQAQGQIFLTNKGNVLTMDIYTAELPKIAAYRYQKTDLYLPLFLGVDYRNEVLIKDLAKFPHMLVAGQTGGGKSTFLHILIAGLLEKNMEKNNINIAIIDLKKLEFFYLNEHCLIVDDERDAARLLSYLNRELDRRLIILRDAKCRNITEYKGGDMPFIVLIIDELAELDSKDGQEDLNRLARLSRAAGIHLVLATQRPCSTLFKDFTKTRALLPARVCFSVADDVNSRIVLGSDAADKIPKNIPGRAVFKWEGEEIIQAMYMGVKECEENLLKIPKLKGVMYYKQCPKRLRAR